MTERTPSTRAGRYAVAAKFVPEHEGHDERWCAYCDVFEYGFTIGRADALREVGERRDFDCDACRAGPDDWPSEFPTVRRIASTANTIRVPRLSSSGDTETA